MLVDLGMICTIGCFSCVFNVGMIPQLLRLEAALYKQQSMWVGMQSVLHCDACTHCTDRLFLWSSGTSIVYPAGAAAAEAASTGDQAQEALQAVITQPLPDRSRTTPSKRKMSSHGMMIVICDEMDQLMSSAQEVLYDLFFMPQVIHSCKDAPVL